MRQEIILKAANLESQFPFHGLMVVFVGMQAMARVRFPMCFFFEGVQNLII